VNAGWFPDQSDATTLSPVGIWGNSSKDATDKEIAARADRQNEQYLGGDPRGLYGIYPPAVSGPEAALSFPDTQQPLPGRKPTLQDALEYEEATSDQLAIRNAREAAIGRVLIEQFIATLRQHGVPTETIYEESRGPTSWSYNKVAGKGWLLQDLGSERSHFQYYYVLPDHGIAKVVRRLPDHEMIKALCYGTRPDNSDQAYVMWASRASQLAQQTRHLSEAARPARLSEANPGAGRHRSPGEATECDDQANKKPNQ
jgi:hypothetical protein